MSVEPVALPAAPVGPPPPASLLYTPASIVPRLDYALLFARCQPVEIELGCGDGSFLLALAQSRPGHNFIGVERLLGRIRKLDRKGRRLGLANLRGVRIEASYFLEFLVPPASAQALHVYFPDPWPKARHERHRLVNQRFPRLAAQALAPGGCVHLRTDDSAYFEQMQTVFRATPEFIPVEVDATLATLLTDFEREFHAEGKATRSASYQLRAGLTPAAGGSVHLS